MQETYSEVSNCTIYHGLYITINLRNQSVYLKSIIQIQLQVFNNVAKNWTIFSYLQANIPIIYVQQLIQKSNQQCS